MTTSVPATSFQNIQVWVKPKANKPGHYDVVTEPINPKITTPNTVINYQIVDTGGYAIVFTGMTVKPKDNGQLSEASVSIDGKLLTFSDANTVKMDLAITLKFKDHDKIEFSHDPQIENDPE